MLEHRNRPGYTRARTGDKPHLEPDVVELLHLHTHNSYDGYEIWTAQPRSIYANTAGDRGCDPSKRRHSSPSQAAGVQGNNDVGLLLVPSQSSNPIKAAARKARCKLALLPGWRRTTLLASFIAIISLIINLVALIWLSRQHPSKSGLVELSQGQCKKIQSTDTWTHLAINIISTLLLSGSNYCMQCLSAPTREELNNAHKKGRYLDIGVPGFRNLRNIAKYKVILWFALALSSVPLHLLYNSAIYSSLSTYDYKIVVVTTAFIDDTARRSQYLEANSDLSRYQRLGPSDCVAQYGQVFLADRSDLVIVSSNTSSNPVVAQSSYNFSASLNPYRPFDWICTSDPNIKSKIAVPKSRPGSDGYYRDEPPPCDNYVSSVKGIANRWAPFGYPIDYCLSLPMEGRCSLNGNIPIVVVVVICNAIKAAIMLFVTFSFKDDPLLTIGDAVGSFLEEPDPTTRGLCLLIRSQVRSRIDRRVDRAYLWPTNRGTSTPVSTTAWSPSYTYFQAASRIRWVWTTGLFLVCCVAVAIMLARSIIFISNQGSTFWGLGFGTVHAQAVVSSWAIQDIKDASQQVMIAILVANTPQAILSFFYFSLNGLLTAIWLASEWSDFDKDRKPLRVSRPSGQQRSTYFLQLPYKVGVPFIIVSALLHWFVSQSIFLAVVSEWSSQSTLINPTAIASCGFSPLAMIFSLALAAVIAVTTLLVSRRKVISTMRLTGSCSAAISAACHPPSWDIDAAEKPVMWGVTHQIAGTHGVGHCSFSSGKVGSLQEGKEYM